MATLNDLIVTARSLTENIDKISNEIRKVEHTLNEYCLFIPFQHKINEEMVISWEKLKGCTTKNRFKLYVLGSDNPLIESKLNVRIKYRPYLTDFVNAFKEFIKKENKMLRNVLDELGDTDNIEAKRDEFDGDMHWNKLNKK